MSQINTFRHYLLLIIIFNRTKSSLPTGPSLWERVISVFLNFSKVAKYLNKGKNELIIITLNFTKTTLHDKGYFCIFFNMFFVVYYHV